MGRRNKLRAIDALEVKRLLWEGTSQIEIATKFGVSQATISRIQNGQSWMEVRWPDNSHGALPAEQEARIWQQRFPHQPVKGVVIEALGEEVDVQSIARMVSNQVEKEEEEEEQEALRKIMEEQEKEE